MLFPTIHFAGNCDEAINFYKKAVNAEVMTIAYAKDAPADSGMEGLPSNFVMHSEILIFGTLVSLTDGIEKMPASSNFCFTIRLDSDEEVTAVFNKLSEGGKIIDPLAPQFFASLWGYVEDKFGVNWSIFNER